MGDIRNIPTIDESLVNGIRNAIEHRATWFYLLLDEVAKNGGDSEKIGRAAIHKCGCFHGNEKMLKNCKNVDDMSEFLKVFADETGQRVFEMEILENTRDKLAIDFHYCPLVTAWQKLGLDQEEIALLCDIAMDGDRGIISTFDGYRFNLEGVIAKGDSVCKIRIEKE
jgi:hypothetical protein